MTPRVLTWASWSVPAATLPATRIADRLEVDVAPAQGGQLAAPQSRKRRGQKEASVLLGGCGTVERPDLLGRVEIKCRRVVALPKLLDVSRWVGGGLDPPGPLENPTENRQRLVARAVPEWPVHGRSEPGEPPLDHTGGDVLETCVAKNRQQPCD